MKRSLMANGYGNKTKGRMTMKKIMTNIKTLAALLMAGAALTACSSEDNFMNEQPVNPTEPKTYTMTVQATKSTGDNMETRGLSLDGKTLNVKWNEGEQVEVVQTSGSTSKSLGTLKAKASTNGITTLTGELVGLQTDAQLKFYLHSASYDYTGQTGVLLSDANSIEEKYDYAFAATNDYTIDGTNVTVPSGINLEAQQSIVKFTFVDNNGNSLNAQSLEIETKNPLVEKMNNIDGTGSSQVKSMTITPASATNVIYAAIPNTEPNKDRPNDYTLTVTDGNGKLYTYTKNVTFTNGKYYEVKVKMTEKPDLLSGVFSVSSTKKVKFSKGNLRYASGTWSFFNNQYDYYTSYSEDAWDKFGWSTSATTYGMNTSKTYGTYSGDFVDWGATMGTGWFTLSSAEWTYLFNTRSASTVGGTENGRYAKAKVNDVQGVILFPDTYTHPDGVTAPTGVNATGDTGWNGNSYTVADWTKMESAGCVFLPAAGCRSGSSVDKLGTFGYFWSATPRGTDSANYVFFKSDDLAFTNYDFLWFACSVRLVRQVE